MLANTAMFGWNTTPPVVGFFRGRFLVAGSFGRILQSDDTFVPIFNERLTLSGFRFEVLPRRDDTYRVQASSNLVDWGTIYEGTGDGRTNVIIDFASGQIFSRFFRVVSP